MLIVVEGVSGAGKTTLARALVIALGQQGRPVIDLAEQERRTADPAWRLGEFMRTTPTPIPPLESGLLYAARTAGRTRLARAHLADQPDAIVVSDRLTLSLAVQLRRLPHDATTRADLLALATADTPVPATILLDVSHAEHRRRLRARGHPPLPAAEFTWLRDAFRAEYDRRAGPGTRIDTSTASPEDVLAVALNVVNNVPTRPAAGATA